MFRKTLIDKFKQFYDIRELVSPAMFARYGHNSWFVFSIEFLTSVIELREFLDTPATCNNWHYADPTKTKIFTQRGWRDNLSQIVTDVTAKDLIYASGHNTCGALDQTFKGMTAEEVRQEAKANDYIFTYKVRFEHKKKDKNGIYQPIPWVHMDVKYYPKNPKVYLFNV